MSIYKKEYVDAQRKRNTIIAMATVALVIIIVISYNLLKKSPELDRTVTPEKPPIVNSPINGTEPPNPIKI